MEWRLGNERSGQSPGPLRRPGGMEAKDAMAGYFGDEFMANYWLGCAMKYLMRHRSKNGREDLLKAIRCIEYLIGTEYPGEVT